MTPINSKNHRINHLKSIMRYNTNNETWTTLPQELREGSMLATSFMVQSSLVEQSALLKCFGTRF
jgi:hypothetical protein